MALEIGDDITVTRQGGFAFEAYRSEGPFALSEAWFDRNRNRIAAMGLRAEGHKNDPFKVAQ
jgi:hypothetical protein